MPYTSEGKSIETLLSDYEARAMDKDYGGSTTEYLHAAIMVRAAQEQRRWAKIAAVAACVSVVVAVVALVVAS